MSFEDEESSYITKGGTHDFPLLLDTTPNPAYNSNKWYSFKNKKGCIKLGYEVLIGAIIVIVLVLPLIYLIINKSVDNRDALPSFMKGWYGLGASNSAYLKFISSKDRLTVTVSEDDKQRFRSRFGQSNADIQASNEVHGMINNVAPDPAVQKVVGKYSDFVSANKDHAPQESKNRKGTNPADSGSNRFAGYESHANQEGSLWEKPSEQGSFIERMGSKNVDWSNKFSESGLDPNKEYVENNEVGQPVYEWGISPARGPRGKTDLILESAAAGF